MWPDKRRARTGSLVLASALVLALLAAPGCGDDEAKAKQQAAAPPPPTVLVATVTTATVPVVREFVARTEAKETITIQARVEAVLESMEFEEGKPVKAGQVLYELDKQTYQANIAGAKAALAGAEANLKLAREQVSVRAAEAAVVQAKASHKKTQQDVARLRPLAEEDAVPRQDLDTALAAEEVAKAEVEAQEANLRNAKIKEEVGILQAEAAIEGAQAALALANLDLGYCTIRSPIDGLIGRTGVDVGNLVGRGEATELATVSSIDPMYVTLAISEEEFLKLQERARAQAKTEPAVAVDLILADGGVYAHKGRFVTIERAVQIETGTLQLVAEFPNPDGLLRDGQFARARVAVAQLENALLVPQRAVMEQQGAKIVLVVGADNVVSLKSVQLTERYEGSFVVTAGLSAGDTVIVEGQLKARPGSPVVPSDKPASAEPADKKGE